MNATPQQLAAIGAACHYQKFNADVKAALVSSFTAGRATSSKDMSLLEAKALLHHLNESNADYKKGEKQRRNIIAMFHEMGKHKPGTQQVDMKALDEWCTTIGHGKKKLDKYTSAELPKLVHQCKEYLRWYLTNI